MPLTNASLPGAAVKVDPKDPYPTVTAKPLGSPDFINLKPKNPLHSIRWGNRTAGEGQRLDQLIASGFRFAKAEEVFLPTPKGQAPCPVSLVRDGRIQNGDVVLLIIPRSEYEGALKYNWERAINRIHPKANHNLGRETLQNTLKEAGIRPTPDLTRKLQTFQPSDKEIEAGEAGSK